MDILVKSNVVTTVREISEGEYYITLTTLRKYGERGVIENVRKRGKDPFVSTTILGSRVHSYPSEKVHPVELIKEPEPK